MVKVSDIEFVRFSAPDLEQMERFLTDFGCIPVESEDGALYVRGSAEAPWIHQTVVGEAGFRGMGFRVETPEELEAASRLEGASAIEELKAPGGGCCVRFTDPDGFEVEVVQGRAFAEPLRVEHAGPLNCGADRPRVRRRQYVPRGPARVRRLGHVVLRVKDYETSARWYRERFGFLKSDEMYLGSENNVITAFMRCDRGEIPVDHHTLLCVGLGETGFDHAAFEVEDIDAVMTGHDHLREAGYEHEAGIGRHILGSQVHVVEHFTDGDLLDASEPSALRDPGVVLGTYWGSAPRP